MKEFMNDDFLLNNEPAKTLYHNFAEEMPIVDYHCHIDPKEIAQDHNFSNITQAWLGGDHYKWRAMRSNGVEEGYITGDAPDREKFQKWAETLEKAIGNPLYHWSHLELQRYFDYHGVLNGDTAQEVWDLCNKKLAQDSFRPRNLIRRSNVTIICTTDDPADTLEYHKQIAGDDSFATTVLPAWRPEKAMEIKKAGFTDYVKRLELSAGTEIRSFHSLMAALKVRMDFFASCGCVVSDHSLDYCMYEPATPQDIETIFQKGFRGEPVSKLEELQYKTAFLLVMGREYHRRGWVMQLHYGVKRNNDEKRFEELGPDTGFDCIRNGAPSDQMADLLNALAVTGELPKTILYSLNPNDNAAIGSVIGCFQEGGTIGKIQQGSAWWFNDNKKGMEEQLISLANLGLLGNFVGMLTDSRSFLSYTRHEYFRRILCNLVGTWVENGEYPWDEERLGQMIQDISYGNAMKYFGFSSK